MIDKIGHYSLTNPSTIYDEEALTALELAARTASKVNQCVDQVNENTTKLPEMVAADVQAHINNGDFDGQVDKYAGELSNEIAEATTTMQNEIRATEESLGNRLDNLLGKVTTGTTTMDAEVIDIRTGADGTIYTSAGAAVRNQLDAINGGLWRITDTMGTGAMAINPDTVLVNTLMDSNNQGKLSANTNYWTSDFIPCKPNEDWTNYHVAHICVFDKYRNFLRGFLCTAENNYILTFNTGEDAAFLRVSKFINTKPYSGGCSFGRGTTVPPIETYMQTMEHTILDEKQFERKRFIEAMMEGLTPVGVEWENGGFDSVGTDTAVDNIFRTGYFRIPGGVKQFKIRNTKGGNLWLIGTDANYNKIWSLPDWTTASEITVENTCTYYRLECQTIASFFKIPVEGVLIYYTQAINGKEEYREGFQYFKVPVNQTLGNSGSDVGSTANVTCVLKLPGDYSATGKPSKLLMMCHGAGKGISGADNWTENPGYQALVEGFNNAGFVVFDCNGYKDDEAGWNFFGCPRGLEAYRKAYDHVTRMYNVEREFSIYGFSMGGLTALNLAFTRFPGIKSIALGSPVINLKNFCWDARGVNNAFALAYGMDPAGSYQDYLVKGCDPYLHINNNRVDKTLPPIKIWFGALEDGSDIDNRTVNKAYGSELVQAIRNANGVAYYRENATGDHSICYGMNPTVNAEYVAWINRFHL